MTGTPKGDTIKRRQSSKDCLFFPPNSTTTFTMCKVMEVIKVSGPREGKGKEYPAGKKGKPDVPEVVKDFSL